jgi:hypothetical protein
MRVNRTVRRFTDTACREYDVTAVTCSPIWRRIQPVDAEIWSALEWRRIV